MNEYFEERFRKIAEKEFKSDIVFKVKMAEYGLPVAKDPRMILMSPIPRDPEPPYRMADGISMDAMWMIQPFGIDHMAVIVRLPNDEYISFPHGCAHRRMLELQHEGTIPWIMRTLEDVQQQNSDIPVVN